MPYMMIMTNTGLSPHKRKDLLNDASRTVADQLGKSENYVMVSYSHDADMVFAGTDDPMAYVELKSIGLPEDQTSALSAALCELMHQHLAIPGERVYIEFSAADRHMWGWNNKTF